MTSRERIRTVMEGGIPDRVPIHDGYWEEALARWQSEGLPTGVAGDKDRLGEYFGTEIRMISVDHSFRFEERVVDEDERYIVKTNEDGAVLKYIKGKTSTPGLISFRVNSCDDWRELKPRLLAVDGRLPSDLAERCRQYADAQRYVVVVVHNPIEAAWSKLGPSHLLEAMKTDPELVRDVFATITDLNITVCEHLFSLGYAVDGAWIWGDIAYTKGLMFSPAMYREILYPFDRRLVQFFTGRGLPVVYHSDGDIRAVIPLLIDAGVRCLQPLEAKAGMDLFDLKRRYGSRLAFMGSVDFDVIARGDREAEQEIRTKVGEGKLGGGYIYHSDHSVPPTVSLARYLRVLEMVEHYGGY